jgi:cell division protein FtsW (lipid II flippase)
MKANNKLAKLVLAAAALTGSFYLGAALAQDSQMRTIEQYTCKDIMRESGGDRDVAIAFLHGFLLGKAGATTFKLDVLHKQTTDFIERCLNNPGDKAVDVMSNLKSE